MGNGSVVTANLLVFAVMLPDCGPGLPGRCSDSLLAGLSGDRILVVVRFSAPFQTGPGAHPTPYTMGTGSFPGVKRPGRGVDHPPPSNAEVQERVELYIRPHLGHRDLLEGELYCHYQTGDAEMCEPGSASSCVSDCITECLNMSRRTDRQKGTLTCCLLYQFSMHILRRARKGAPFVLQTQSVNALVISAPISPSHPLNTPAFFPSISLHETNKQTKNSWPYFIENQSLVLRFSRVPEKVGLNRKS